MSDQTPAEILAEIRAERVALEKLQTTLGQRRRGNLGDRCGAATSSGTPCKRRPEIGGTRCFVHGGSSPIAREAAERRLRFGVGLAVDRLTDALSEHEHDVTCGTCGCNPSSRDPNTIRAAIAVLDRAGFGPGLTLHTTEEEVRVDEVRITVVDVDPEQLAEYKASDRALRAERAERRAKYNQEPEPEPKPKPKPDDRHRLLPDLETDR